MVHTLVAKQAADVIATRTGIDRHSLAIVMGSGWLPAADELGTAHVDLPMTDIPGFTTPIAEGHGNTIRSLTIGGQRVLVFLGRTHYYENRDVQAVAHTARTAAAAGVERIILTNGCGGLNPAWSPGTPVLISDHLNLTAASPLLGAEFVDLTDLYSPALRALARSIEPDLPEGVYAQVTGPHYETPAEIRMLRTLGADMVGMSTALDAIAARAAGLEVLGLSLVTNLAAGMTGEPLSHEEVLAAGQSAATRMGGLLREIAERL